ncbi:MAG: tRNA dihydrouridine synthase DusB [Syntrophomonadaceae bacterium]|nr:tRNA dihydrouridine synthase DusB [Syntrophomonadaceae bacterium]
MFSIGDVKIKNRVMAAPLAGVSDKAYRITAKSFGCSLTFTEMISDMGLVCGQEKTRKMADTSGEDPPVAVQIFGSKSEIMGKAAAIAEQMGAGIIDINMGCPTPKIVKNGEGAALMLDISRSRAIIREVVKSVKVPVTVKMRKGWDENSVNCLELAAVAEQEGASAVILHPRTRMQFFSGRADWDMIKELKKQVSIPVIGNGDIWSAADALRMLEYTGCDAVMIGRAAMGNPFIFQQSVELVENGRTVDPPDLEERVNTAVRHLDLACRFKGEAVAVREMRKHFSWYIKGLRGAARLRERINQAAARDELVKIIQEIK